MKINSNIAALITSRNINRSNDKIASSLEKLSTGYKINKVSDDPAGTAVSSKVKAQLYGLKLASKNSMDGISLVQTAEGAMTETHEMLKRMRELAVQAANDTNSPDDRQKIQVEVDQLIQSIAQMADVTEFNQMKLLNGSLSNLTTISKEVAPSNDILSNDISVKYMSPNFPTDEYTLEILASASCSTIIAEYSDAGGTITINTDTIEIEPGSTEEQIQSQIIDLANRYNCVADFTNAPEFKLTSKETGADVDLVMEGTAVSNVTNARGASAEVKLGPEFSNAAVVTTEGNRIFITESNGSELIIDINDLSASGKYTVKIEDKGQLKLQTGANEEQRIALMIPGVTTDGLGLTKKSFAPGANGNEEVNLVNVKNTKSAEQSIALLDEAIAKVSDMRSTLGAYQNRLEHTVRSLDINSTNTAEALSRLQDTDMALEMSNYTLNNVILQSGISMLSQANERPQQLLQLLR